MATASTHKGIWSYVCASRMQRIRSTGLNREPRGLMYRNEIQKRSSDVFG